MEYESGCGTHQGSVIHVLRLGCWRRETERFRRGEQGPQEVAERPSQVPTEAHAAAPILSRNEHARSRASSTGVGVRGDAARSACWFPRITHKEDETGRNSVRRRI